MHELPATDSSGYYPPGTVTVTISYDRTVAHISRRNDHPWTWAGIAQVPGPRQHSGRNRHEAV
jgi:hypothetical protein